MKKRLPAVKELPAVPPEVQLPASISRESFHRLTPREQSFVLHPEVMKDPVKAALDAGYKESTARTRAHTMRKQLMYYIRAITQQNMAERGITLDRVEKEIGVIAFANEMDYFERVDTGDDTILVQKDPTLLTEEQQRAILNVTLHDTILSDGSRQQTFSVMLHDKKPMLKLLAEMLGGLDPRNRLPTDAETRKQQAELFDFMSPEELKTVERIYAEANSRMQKSLRSKIADKEAIDGEATPAP